MFENDFIFSPYTVYSRKSFSVTKVSGQSDDITKPKKKNKWIKFNQYVFKQFKIGNLIDF